MLQALGEGQYIFAWLFWKAMKKSKKKNKLITSIKLLNFMQIKLCST